MAQHPSPPRLARALATLLIKGEAREVIVGDLDQEFVETIASGARPAAARRLYWRQTLASIAAVRRGGTRYSPVTVRTVASPLRGLSLDLTAVLRVLRRSPGYAAIAILSLAIGIGANTTIFSVVRQLLMAPLGVERPDELRLVYWTPRHQGPLGIGNIGASAFTDPSGTSFRSNFNYPQFAAMRQAVAPSADLAGYNFLRQLTVSAEGRGTIAASGMLVSGNFFQTVRPPLALGRGLTDADDTAGAAPVAVISHSLWTRLFDNQAWALGRVLRVNDVPLNVVGVTAASYRGLSSGGFVPPADVTIAMAKQPAISPEWGRSLFTAPKAYWVRLIARTTGPESGFQGRLQATLAGMLVDGGIKPDIAARSSVGVFPGVRGLDSLRQNILIPLRLLAVVCAVVLLIACLNVAGLMLARGVARQKELAVRRALGAGRTRILRELLLESVILSFAGASAGLLVALLMAPALQAMLTAGLGTTGVSVSLDWPLIAATATIACAAGILAGLLPAVRFSRNAAGMLNDRSGAAGAPKLKIGRALLVLQIAISLPLVAGAGLFLRTLHNLGNVELGFNPHGLVLFNVDPTLNGKMPERTESIFPRLLERLEAIPGVTSATLLENALISGSESDTTATINGREVHIYMNAVGPHYVETMGIRLVAGRSIRSTDSAGVPPVVVINETAARQFFKDGSPIGGRIIDAWGDREVIGVVADTKYDGLRNVVEPTMLQSYLQRRMGSMTVAVRSNAGGPLRTAIEGALRDVDPSLPITGFKTQLEQIDQSIGKELVFSRLLTIFGGFALLLACVGLHGVTSYSVARRTSEIGIRLALGAPRSQVLWMVLRQVVILAAIGLAIGLPIAWLASPFASAFLFGLGPRDPITILAAAALMVVVAVGAGLRPAQRAARMEALSALRSE